MIKQPQWNIHEAAILLDGFLKIQSATLTKAEAILSVSQQLRTLAKKNGIAIDDTYRNVNGISFQMASMESAFFGRTIMKPATRLFAKMVIIYRTDIEEYRRLLKEAQVMLNGQKMTKEEAYLTWLASKISPAQLSELYGTYKDIEEFCRRVKVIRQPLFETLDYNTAKKVQQTIESNKAFRFFHKRHMSKYISATSYYCRYLKELEAQKNSVQESLQKEYSVAEIKSPVDAVNTQNDKDVFSDILVPPNERVKTVLMEECEKNPFGTTVAYIQNALPEIRANDIKQILDSAPWAKYEFGTWKYVSIPVETGDFIPAEPIEPMTSDLDTEVRDRHAIDFNNIPALVYTKPISFSYFDEVTDGLRSWTELYTAFFTVLYEDYSHILKVGMSFTTHNDGRIEFGDSEMAKVMKAPKPITTEQGETYYVETNLSAFSLVGKIKFLLDLCSVDYENVVIQYVSSDFVPHDNPTTSIVQNRNSSLDDFSQWLLQSGCALATARNYMAAVRYAETYAIEHSLEFQKLITDDHDLCKKTAAALFQNDEFVELNKRQHYRFRAAIAKLFEYYEIKYDFIIGKTTPKATASAPKIDTTPFEKVLAEKFVRGFRIGSPLDMKKFRRFYIEINGVATEFTDSDVEAALLSCGIHYDDKVFAPAVMLPAEMRDRLFSFIRESFSEGKQAVYYEALFRSFSDAFLDYYIYDAQMLKAYIAFYNHGEFYLESQYICKDTLTQANPLEEVKNYLVTAGVPVESTEICEILSHIPQKKIMQILGMNAAFVNNGKGYYFHVDVVHLSEEEMENVADLIQEGIREKLFLSGKELIAMIHARYPFIIENNPAISALGMRDTLKYHLNERFSFKGNIISGLDHALSMADVFGNYAKSRPEFTADELTTLALEMNATIYFDAVYDNSLRVSRNQFVAKERAQFLIDETDKAIDRFCTGSYLAIGKVDGFGSFPDAGFPWNSYLLEHYVYAYSKKYRLFHVGFNRDCCVGAIAKKESGIRAFDDLLALVLAQSDISLKKEQALAFLVKEGYLARRNYSNIEKVLIQANTYRNRKGTR